MHLWVTGDIHGNPYRLFEEVFYEQKDMKKQEDNGIIICGDTAFLWDYRGKNQAEEDVLDWLSTKPFTVLFVDGNHENFTRLNALPVEPWNGGKVHKLRKNVIHLMRGEVFCIGNRKIFAFGGGKSHDIFDGILDLEKDARKIEEWTKKGDKFFRVNEVSWWKAEMPCDDEMENGIRNLTKHDWKVDYVITHSPSSEMLSLFPEHYGTDALTDYLSKIQERLDYQYWFCGHMHMNWNITKKDLCLYEQILKVQ